MKVAIVHYWLVGMRGGEKVIENLLELYPDAVIVTHVYDPSAVSSRIRSAEVRETFVGRLPMAKKHYQKYLPLMPLALEGIDMQEFDLIISSESGPAKGIIPRPDAVHICYCHSPMRYIWDHYHIYFKSSGRVARIFLPFVAHRMRIWDVTSAARVDKFVANSNFVAARILKYYRREADIVPPPVSVNDFEISPCIGDHYLMAGELVSYKRPDLAVAAFNASGRKLTIIGDGPMRLELERKANHNITFLGKVPFHQLKQEFARCRGLIFPGEEDFGIIPVEVMACGRPIVAFGRGGILDTVRSGETGVFFGDQSPDSLNIAINNLESNPKFFNSPEFIRNHAKGFDSELFKERIQDIVQREFKLKNLRLQSNGSVAQIS